MDKERLCLGEDVISKLRLLNNELVPDDSAWIEEKMPSNMKPRNSELVQGDLKI